MAPVELWIGTARTSFELAELSVETLREALAKEHGIPAQCQLLSSDGRPFVESKGPLPAAPLHVQDLRQLRPTRSDGQLAGAQRIERTEERGIALQQLKALLAFVQATASEELLPWRGKDGAWIHPTRMNLYDCTAWIIKPATRPDQCSYVELVTEDPLSQRPKWFVSHAWSEPVASFAQCLEQHSRLRDLEDKDAWWVCAYANNQHELGTDLTHDPLHSSFFRAMCLCEGVLLVLDQDATPFRRIWCCFEQSVAITATRENRLLLDISHCPESAAQAEVITDGVTVTDLREKKRTIYRNIDGYEDSVKAHREAAFPISLILQALTVISVKNASASQPIDKVRILNTICKQTSLDSDPPDSSPHYDEVDSGLRAIFALSALPICAKRGLREELGSIAEVLRKDTREREALNLNLTDMAELRDELLGCLAPTFPPKLQDLTLHLTRCVKISDAGIQALCKCMPKALRRMHVAFFGCGNLTDEGLKAIGEALPSSLRHLRLSFGECRQVTDAGVQHLASRLPKKLLELNLNFEGCELLGEEAAASLGRKLPTTLHALVLNFMGCHHVSDHGVATLAEGLPDLQQFDLGCFAIAASDVGAAKLPTTLQSFALDLRSTNVTDVGISTLAASVPDGTDVKWQFAKSDGAGNTELTCLKDLRVWQESAPAPSPTLAGPPARALRSKAKAKPKSSGVRGREINWSK